MTPGPGSDLDQGVTSTLSSGSDHCGTLLLDLPHHGYYDLNDLC